jgi:hypothetical protein
MARAMNTVVEFAGAFQSIGVDRIAGSDRHDGEIGGAGAIARGGGNEYNLGRNRR